MGQKRPIETDLHESDFEEFLAMATDAAMTPEELFYELLQEGLKQTRVQKREAQVISMPPRKHNERHE